MTGEPSVSPVPVQREGPPPPAVRFVASSVAADAVERLSDLARRLLGTSAAHVRLVDTAPDGTAPVDAPCDGMCALSTLTDTPLVVDDARTDPRFRELPGVADGQVAAFLGVPLTDLRGTVLGVLCVCDPAPRAWTPADEQALTQLARSVVAELELAALAGQYQGTLDRWELAIDAAGVGSFDWDLTTGRLLLGRPPDGDVRPDRRGVRRHASTTSRPGCTPRTSPACARCSSTPAQTCSTWAVDYRVVQPDGSHPLGHRPRARAARGRAARPSACWARPTTPPTCTTARPAPRGCSRRCRRPSTPSTATGASPTSTPRPSASSGRPRDELLGGVVWELFPAAVASDFEANFRARGAHRARRSTFEAYYPPPLDGWYELRVVAVAGRAVGLLPRRHRPARRPGRAASGPCAGPGSSPT